MDNTAATPRDIIEALTAHLTTTNGTDVEWGIADRDYALTWDNVVAGPGIEATIWDVTDEDDREVATVRVTFEVTS